MLWALLPLLSTLLLTSSLRMLNRDGWRESLLSAGICISAVIVIITEGLSAFHAFTRTNVLSCWLIVALAGLYTAARLHGLIQPEHRAQISIRSAGGVRNFV
jgi:hypothetical protein